ncbi:MAG: cation diffusion facilitator family transporter [Spirochaetales bacterium]
MPDQLSRAAERVALLSVISNTCLTLMKFIVASMTGSVSILSEGLHSSMDLVASVIAFIAVRMSRRPADAEHPWGHGKAENVSGVAEGVLIFVAAALIVSEAVQKLVSPHEVDSPLLGMAVMGVSAVVNTVVAFLLFRTAKKTGSLALEADALHLKTDVYTSVGVAVGLGLMTLTGWPILDPIAALLVSALIVKEAWNLVKRSFAPLMDGTLPPGERAEVEKVIADTLAGNAGYHNLKARRAGHRIFVEFHLTLPGTVSLTEAHTVTERVEAALTARWEHAEALIHMEPEGV